MLKFFLFMQANWKGVNWVPTTSKFSVVIWFDFYVTSRLLKVLKFIRTINKCELARDDSYVIGCTCAFIQETRVLPHNLELLTVA